MLGFYKLVNNYRNRIVGSDFFYKNKAIEKVRAATSKLHSCSCQTKHNIIIGCPINRVHIPRGSYLQFFLILV